MGGIYAFDDFELDGARLELRRDGTPIEVLRLLLYLVQHRARAVPGEELLRELWPDSLGYQFARDVREVGAVWPAARTHAAGHAAQDRSVDPLPRGGHLDGLVLYGRGLARQYMVHALELTPQA